MLHLQIEIAEVEEGYCGVEAGGIEKSRKSLLFASFCFGERPQGSQASIPIFARQVTWSLIVDMNQVGGKTRAGLSFNVQHTSKLDVGVLNGAVKER